MSKELKTIGEEYRKASNDSYLAVVRSVGEVHKGLEGIATELTEHSRRSVGRAFEIQAQLARRAYDTYISQLTKFGKVLFAGYGTFLARVEEQLPNAGHPQLAFRGAAQRTAAHGVTAKRKTGTAKRSRSSTKRAKTKK
jgi:hypothetical protein